MIVLADVSGSMLPNQHEDKIGVLNRCIASMFSAFARMDSVRGQVHVGAITFGGAEARVHLPIGPATEANWVAMEAGGGTPMGAAFDLAREILDDPASVSGRAFEPALILVSDGVPTDDWEPALNELLGNRLGGKAMRLSVGIGTDRTPDAEEVLAQFSGPEFGVLRADQASELPELFRWITDTVTSTFRPSLAVPNLEDFDRA
ncbi:vWA domain-containing protein [Glycomyces harbinensis]|uniref:Uncharacterized conserved protein YegL, contains vWA domain of TerY type n=1 Tax=Glycomyces harbinensis TaxID=58114 RepID=A0A1G7AZT9_9ACTN|nr:VWA domain-containing protein [Glycomyces harbinensis]SDE20313.1 Uncharacterized conserved protein YegL, contains vWA domain of TerY type [Glycomyces harbinensis]